MGFELPGDCSGKMCGYSYHKGDLGCETGSGSCWVADLCEAEASNFHDETLQRATREIKGILEAIPPDREGRKLSFVHTEHGTLLAWVRHGVSVPEDRINFDSGADKVKEALRIRDTGPAKAS